MKATCSINIGKGKTNFRHNSDKFYRENLENTSLNSERKIYVLEDYSDGRYSLSNETKTEILERHRFDDDSSIQDYLDEYNKDKRKERQIDLEKLANKKVQGGHNFFEPQEIILQIGNQKSFEEVFSLMPNNTEKLYIEREESIQILTKVVENFKEQTKGKCEIIQAVIHDDESSPHLHLVFLPLVKQETKTKGLPFSTNLNAMIQQVLPQETLEQIKNQQAQEQQIASLNYDPLSKTPKKASRKTKAQLDRDYMTASFTAFREQIEASVAQEAKQYQIEIENPHNKEVEHLETSDWREAQKIKADAEKLKEYSCQIACTEEKVNLVDRLAKALNALDTNDLEKKLKDKVNSTARERDTLKQENEKLKTNINKEFENIALNLQWVGEMIAQNCDREFLDYLNDNMTSDFVKEQLNEGYEKEAQSQEQGNYFVR